MRELELFKKSIHALRNNCTVPDSGLDCFLGDLLNTDDEPWELIKRYYIFMEIEIFTRVCALYELYK